jgi:3-hydroxyacyl-CoA dehydrogenase
MKGPALPETIAVVGTGVIGRSWVQVFARAGWSTRVYDLDPQRTEAALVWFRSDVQRDLADGKLDADEAAKRLSLVSGHDDLGETLEGVAYVQESGPENLTLKQRLYADLDRLAGPETILASSTSAIDMTEIAEGLPGARRCVVAHPVNPPHVIPVVEMVPGKETAPEILERACQIMTAVGQKPVKMNFYLPSFILNRMQEALFREAFYIVQSGAADVEAVDTTMRDGLGLRWALLGPFGTSNLNGDHGIQEYFERYGPTYEEGWREQHELPIPELSPELMDLVGGQTNAMYGTDYAGLRRWRDEMVMAIRELKEQRPEPSG